MGDDSLLLKQYVGDHSEAAFTALVQRHVNLVYSAALRQLGGDAHLASDASQGVFLALAQNARRLVHHTALTGWLYTTTRYVCAKLVRTRQRARTREETASSMNQILEEGPAEPDWSAVRDVLDDAMHELGPRDREALLLRHFEGRSFGEIGEVCGLGENAAQMRVKRATEKLRSRLAHRGIMSTAAALGAALTAHGAATAPAGLANAAATLALAGATTATSGLAGTVAWLQFMSTTKLKVAATAAVLTLAVGGYLSSEWRHRAEPTSIASTVVPQTPRQDTTPATSSERAADTDEASRAPTAPEANPNPPAANASSTGLNAAEQNVMLTSQKLQATAARSGIEQRYGGLFPRLGLPPTELEKLRDLLIERQLITSDTMMAAQARGIDLETNSAQWKVLNDKSRADVDENIRIILGDERYRVYQDYTENASSYILLDQIEQRLSDTRAPLRKSQSEPLLRLLVDTASSTPAAFAQGPLQGVTAAMSESDPLLAAAARGPISDETIARAQSILTPVQVETLRQIQSEQKSRDDAMRGLIQTDSGEPASAPQSAGTSSSSKP
ncbi:MAG TPA: sigma-70 family RNA polymerase sigma factor [Opitutaceae bacterium]|nr:sigma-70 family RNA polymerase sigma factor [Opitutaceae bacterium]